ncbi:hypothetical protein AOQ84DRAFT_303772 [Glonium stellatum]|uniref:Uncharacterized protein n=1 Tax=Glonium stellatum TaxID=574774 RepID=A0A8E2JMW1_9PEZI|nr:hypothetical protein AOQ84DRAFT_303772 [Glonium stellatum]
MPNASESTATTVERTRPVEDKPTRPRPQSMYQKGTVETTIETKRRSQIIEPSDASRKTSISQPSAINRSQSLRKPAPSGQTTRSFGLRSHVKNLSTNTTSSPNLVIAESVTDADNNGKPSLGRPSTAHAQDGSMSTGDSESSGVRSSQRIANMKAGHKRTASTTSKPERPDSSASTGTTDTDPALSTSGATRRREPAKEEGTRRPRPAFSTLQQHFTPKKTVKALTSTFINPPAPDPAAGGTMSVDVIRLQAELLQLHLLHESSAQNNKQWELSVKRKLHQKFDEVASMYQVMRDNERQTREQVNLRALQEWNSGSASFGLAENIQLLSAPLHELPGLVDPGGRYVRLVDDFEEWMNCVSRVWEKREHSLQAGVRDLDSAEGLGDAWKAENAALTRKLTVFSRDLETLTEPAPGSSVAAVVSSCRELLRGMLQELRIMQTIEAEVVSRERGWIEGGLAALAEDITAHLMDTQEGSESWRD